MRVSRRFVAIPEGEIHYAEAGGGKPVLLLHQTPRSWREYHAVLPLLARSRRAIAMDTVGFGDSTGVGVPDAIDAYARAVLHFLDALELEQVAVVGHHTGGVIAIELAAAHPDRVARVVLSCTPLHDHGAPLPDRVMDEVPRREDGSHLVELWNGRRSIYPPGRPDLLTGLPGSRVVEIEGGMCPLPEQHPEVFARAVLDFLVSPWPATA